MKNIIRKMATIIIAFALVSAFYAPTAAALTDVSNTSRRNTREPLQSYRQIAEELMGNNSIAQLVADAANNQNRFSDRAAATARVSASYTLTPYILNAKTGEPEAQPQIHNNEFGNVFDATSLSPLLVDELDSFMESAMFDMRQNSNNISHYEMELTVISSFVQNQVFDQEHRQLSLGAKESYSLIIDWKNNEPRIASIVGNNMRFQEKGEHSIFATNYNIAQAERLLTWGARDGTAAEQIIIPVNTALEFSSPLLDTTMNLHDDIYGFSSYVTTTAGATLEEVINLVFDATEDAAKGVSIQEESLSPDNAQELDTLTAQVQIAGEIANIGTSGIKEKNSLLSDLIKSKNDTEFFEISPRSSANTVPVNDSRAREPIKNYADLAQVLVGDNSAAQLVTSAANKQNEFSDREPASAEVKISYIISPYKINVKTGQPEKQSLIKNNDFKRVCDTNNLSTLTTSDLNSVMQSATTEMRKNSKDISYFEFNLTVASAFVQNQETTLGKKAISFGSSESYTMILNWDDGDLRIASIVGNSLSFSNKDYYRLYLNNFTVGKGKRVFSGGTWDGSYTQRIIVDENSAQDMEMPLLSTGMSFQDDLYGFSSYTTNTSGMSLAEVVGLVMDAASGKAKGVSLPAESLPAKSESTTPTESSYANANTNSVYYGYQGRTGGNAGLSSTSIPVPENLPLFNENADIENMVDPETLMAQQKEELEQLTAQIQNVAQNSDLGKSLTSKDADKEKEIRTLDDSDIYEEKNIELLSFIKAENDGTPLAVTDKNLGSMNNMILYIFLGAGVLLTGLIVHITYKLLPKRKKNNFDK